MHCVGFSVTYKLLNSVLFQMIKSMGKYCLAFGLGANGATGHLFYIHVKRLDLPLNTVRPKIQSAYITVVHA